MEKQRKTPQEIITTGSTKERLAFTAATALTIARPILAGVVAKRGLDRKHDWTTTDAALLSAAYLTDLEGNVARAGNAETDFGAAADPFADKAATNPHEIVLAMRGEDSPTRVGARLARDVALTGIRIHVKNSTNGRAEIGANKINKVNSGLRQVTDIFATSPFGRKYPRVRTGLQIASTALTLATGIYAGTKMLRDARRIKREDRQASHE